MDRIIVFNRRIQKRIIIFVIAAVGISTPFFIYNQWTSTLRQIAEQEQYGTQTLQQWSGHLLVDVGLTGILLVSILLALIIFYLLVSQNDRLTESYTFNRSMVAYTEDLLQTGSKQTQYQKIIKNLVHMTEARIGLMTLRDENTGKYRTIASAGPEDVLRKLEQLLGGLLSGREWNGIFAEETSLDDRVVIHFSSLRFFKEYNIKEELIRRIETEVPFSEVIFIKIIADNETVGNFLLAMPVGERLEDDSSVEIYSRQINMFMTRIKAEERLLTSEKRLLSAQSLAHVGNWELNLATKEIWASVEAFNIYGIPYNPRGIALNLIQKSIFPEYRQNLDKVLQDLIAANEKYDQKFKIKNLATGNTRFVHSKALLETDDAGNPVKVVGAIQDITNYKKSEDEILYLSFHDQLTGLYNRRYYEKRLAALDTPENLPFTIVMGDVNGLKLVNDSFGHSMGDTILVKAAKVLTNGCRQRDIIARFGGDEFIIILPKTDAAEAERIINHIQELARDEKINAIALSIAFGYKTKTTMDESTLQLLKEMEDHMYRNKLCESYSMRSRTIDLILKALYEKNDRERIHANKVGELCEAIATRMNFDKDDINQIKIAGLMHDIGNIGIDEKILNKPCALTKEEWKEVERHSEIGYRILSSVNEFARIADFVLEHHERWDGKGYPRGLKGEQISLQARIIALAGAFAAMTGYRTFKEAMSENESLEEIKRCAGTQFDPSIVGIFVDMIRQMNRPL